MKPSFIPKTLLSGLLISAGVQLTVDRWLQRSSLLLCLLLLVGSSSRTFGAATIGNGATMEVLGVGSIALLGSDLTDPENDGDEAAGPTSPTWNWRSISSSAEPGFGGGEFSYNVFDNVADGGGNAKWCCGEPVTAATLAATSLHITVQLNDRYRLTHFTVTSGNDTPARDPRDWQILGSSDGITFEPIFTQVGTNTTHSLWGVERNQVIKVTLDAPARPYTFFRFRCTGVAGSTAAAFFQLTEIEYFGLQGGALTVEIVGIGTAALLKSDLTDPDNNGNKAAGPTDPSWNWTSITSNNKPAFGTDGAFNVFDNSVDGSTNKWCCDDATAASPLNVTVEFPRGLALTHFTITSADDAPDGDPTKFQILGSTNGTTFTPIYPRDSATSLWTARNQVIRVTLQDPSPLYKFIRYEATETPGPIHQLAEIEYFGKYGGVNNPLVSDVFQSASFVAVQVTDGSDTILDPATVQLVVDTNVVTTTLSKVGSVTTVNHARTPFFASGSSHTWAFTAKDDAGNPLARAGSFITPTYTTIPAAYAVASVDTSKPGFRARVYQMPVPRGPGNRGLAANAERAIALGYIDPSTGAPYVNTADLTGAVNGFIEVPGVINLHETPGGNVANFPNDETMPGIPGSSTTSGDFYVVEFQTYLDLKAGAYRFGVNSDDGFLLSAGRGSGDVVGLQLAIQNGTRGAADTIFDFVAPTNGFYPIRLVYNENIGAGSEVEFFMIDLLTGTRTLINDTNAASTILAYRESAVGRPYVSKSLPARNYGFAFATDDLVVEITDGAVPVNSGSVTLTLNGVAVTNITKTGNVTTISRPGSLSNLLPSGLNTITNIYSFTEGASTVFVTNVWSYTVVPYATISAATKVAAGTVTGSGYTALGKQIDRSGDANQGNGERLFTGDGNRMPRPEIHLANGNINPTNGLPYPNLAQAGGNPDGSFTLDILNYNSTTTGTANSGVFAGDTAVPGLPGTGTSQSGIDSYVMEIVTYLDLKAGSYLLAVNSDDGFVAISGLDAHDTLGTRIGFFNGGRGNAGTLPVPSTTAANTVPTPGTTGGNSAFGVIVPEDGIYPVRLLWWQGGGGVNLEFMSVDRNNGIEVLVNDTALQWPAANVPFGSAASAIQAFSSYTGPARPWTKFSVSPEEWDNRHQQAGPGPILTYGRTRNNVESSDIYNDADNRRPWADVRIGGTVANAVGDATLRLLLDGAPVAATFTTNGTDITISFKPAVPLASGSTHTAALVYGGTTNRWTFTVQTYVGLPATSALPLLQTDPNAVGFQAKVFQATTGQANTVARAESQITGGIASVALPGPNADGSYTIPGIVNWNNNVQTNPSGIQIGNFQANTYGTGWPFPDYADVPIPGLPGTGLANTDNCAAEIFAYLRFDIAGHYRFGVNGDDGFAVKLGTPGVTNGTVIFSIDVGKVASDIPFSFTVPQAGLYPIRLVYYNGGGGATLEFFSYDDAGNKIAINDTNNPASIKAYYNVQAAPVIVITSPTNNTLYPDFPTNVTITADATVQNSTIALVEFFYKSTNKIGEATTFPYSAAWNNVPAGRYSLTAKATAANGISAVSAPVRIIVGTPVTSNVAETGGDNEATDTVTAKWTGVTYVGGIANEPIAGLAAGASYMVELFQEEAPAYVDRNHQWNGATAALPLPGYLVGNEYIMAGNDNRDNTNYNLAITLSVEADVYMLVDNRVGDGAAADPPNFTLDRTGDGQPDMAWLLQQGWKPVTNGLNRAANPAWPDEVGVDEGGNGVGPGGDIQNWSSVYVKRIPAGTFSVLQPDNNGQNMYGVVIARVLPPGLEFTTITASGGNVTMTWTGIGVLEEAAILTGSPTDWSDVNPQPTGNTHTVTGATGNKFYRLRGTP